MAAVSVVTGAGSGIGAATAAVLSARGDRVVCVDIDAGRAEETAAQLDGAVATAADVTSPEEVAGVVAETLNRFGDLHHVVTCAGIETGATPSMSTSRPFAGSSTSISPGASSRCRRRRGPCAISGMGAPPS